MNALRRALAALLLVSAAAAQALPNPVPPAVPPTQLGVEVLSVSPVVVVARVIAVRPAGGGSELVRVRVVERMRGTAQVDAELSVLAPAAALPFGEEVLLFLRPWRGGERYEIVQRLSAHEAHYVERLSVVRRTIWLLEVHDPQRRIDATLDLLLELLATDKEWTRGYALGELRWMAQQQGAVFTPERLARLRAVGRTSPHRDVRAGVDSVTSLLTSPPARAPANGATEHSRP